MKSLLIGFTMTFFPMFDLPVFWPVLLLYWIMLFTVTMKKQIKHMIKYKYLPFSLGKKVSPFFARCFFRSRLLTSSFPLFDSFLEIFLKRVLASQGLRRVYSKNIV